MCSLTLRRISESWVLQMQIETEGDAVTACAFSSCGEMMALGGSGGYAHLWATSATPRVNMVSRPLDFPTPPSKPARLTEQDSFALPFPYGATQVTLPYLKPFLAGVLCLCLICPPVHSCNDTFAGQNHEVLARQQCAYITPFCT